MRNGLFFMILLESNLISLYEGNKEELWGSSSPSASSGVSSNGFSQLPIHADSAVSLHLALKHMITREFPRFYIVTNLRERELIQSIWDTKIRNIHIFIRQHKCLLHLSLSGSILISQHHMLVLVCYVRIALPYQCWLALSCRGALCGS